jgi:type I restriction enzyme S subunit
MEPKIRLKGFTEPWEEKNLTDVVNLYSGLTYSPSNIREQGTLVLRSSNVQNGEVSLLDNVYVDSSVVNCSNVKKGDVIVVVRNGSRALIGKHALIKENMENTVVGAFMTGMRSDIPDFVNALLGSPRFDHEVEINLGATINQITNGTFHSMSFFFPKDKNEIDAVGNYFTKLDSLISSSLSRLLALKHIKAASFQTLFPKKGDMLPKLRFKGFSGDWKKAILGDIFSERNESNVNGEMLSVTMNSGIIKASNNGRFDNSNSDKSKYKVVKIGDIAYNSMRMWQGASGYSKFEGIVSPAYTVVVPHEDIDSLFFAYMFKTSTMINLFRLNSQGLTTDTWNLKYPAFSTLEVIYPESKEEQKKIANYFSSIDLLIELQSQRLEKLKQIKSACLDKMFV